MTSTSLKVGDEIEVDGKVYVVALNANMILARGEVCEGCAAYSDTYICRSLSDIDEMGQRVCKVERHLIFKLKGDGDVQDENADDRQVSTTQEGQPTDMG